jgi:hypothetical protein
MGKVNLNTPMKRDGRLRTPFARSRFRWSSKWAAYGREPQKVLGLHTDADKAGMCSVLFTYEEASAACIYDLLRHVSNGQYREALKKAERFIFHVEVIFGAIDDIEEHFVQLNIQGAISTFGLSHVSQ